MADDTVPDSKASNDASPSLKDGRWRLFALAGLPEGRNGLPEPSLRPALASNDLARALTRNPQFELVEPSGKGFVIGGQSPAQTKR